MPLITREEKGSKLTIQEMDGNLLYLESLGISDIQSESGNIILERTNSEQITLTLPEEDGTDLETYISRRELSDGSYFYKGVQVEKPEASFSSLQLKYNTEVGVRSPISTVYGRSYFYIGWGVFSRNPGTYSTFFLRSYLFSNKSSPGNFTNSNNLNGFFRPEEISNIFLSSTGGILTINFSPNTVYTILDFQILEIQEF